MVDISTAGVRAHIARGLAMLPELADELDRLIAENRALRAELDAIKAAAAPLPMAEEERLP